MTNIKSNLIHHEELMLSISNAGTLSHEQNKIILEQLKAGVFNIYSPLSTRCKVNGLDLMVYAMLKSALDIYVRFHYNNRTISLSEWKRETVITAQTIQEIKHYAQQIERQARFLLINYGNTEARNFTMIVQQIFSQINEACKFGSDHNFERNIFKNLFDNCLLALEIEYNTEVLKLRNAILPETNKSNKVSVLTAFEIALKHWFLVKCHEKPYIKPVQVGEMYGHLKDKKNIEMRYRELEQKNPSRQAKLQELQNVLAELSEYPSALQMVKSEIINLI